MMFIELSNDYLLLSVTYSIKEHRYLLQDLRSTNPTCHTALQQVKAERDTVVADS